MSGKKIKTFVDTPAQSFKNKTSFKRFFRNLPGFWSFEFEIYLAFGACNLAFLNLNLNFFLVIFLILPF